MHDESMDPFERSRADLRRRGSGQLPDFRIEFSNSDGWRVLFVNERARSWASRNLDAALIERSGAEIRTTLAGVNAIVGKARRDGFVSEYVGPNETVRL